MAEGVQDAEESGPDLQAVAGPIYILKDGSVTSMINFIREKLAPEMAKIFICLKKE